MRYSPSGFVVFCLDMRLLWSVLRKSGPRFKSDDEPCECLMFFFFFFFLWRFSLLDPSVWWWPVTPTLGQLFLTSSTASPRMSAWWSAVIFAWWAKYVYCCSSSIRLNILKKPHACFKLITELKHDFNHERTPGWLWTNWSTAANFIILSSRLSVWIGTSPNLPFFFFF